MNACYSAEMSKALSGIAEVVIGVRGKIGDPAALDFARSFYSALATSCSVEAAFTLANIELELSGADTGLLQIEYRKDVDPRRIMFHARPELMARFRMAHDKPVVRNGHYEIELWVRGADRTIDTVSCEIHHDSFATEDRYWAVTRSESSEFLTEDFATSGDVTIRIVAWSRDRGLGAESKVSDALRRNYYGQGSEIIVAAIAAVAAG